jgi:hypothetical protein
MKKALLLVISLVVMPVDASPVKILDAYFGAIATNDFAGLGKNMLPQHRKDVKQLMVELVDSKSPSVQSMENRIFGEEVDGLLASGKSGEFYMEQLFSLLNSEVGQMSLAVEDHTVLGEIAENRHQKHILVRITLSQNEKTTSSISVYSFKKEDGQWYMEYPAVLKGYLELVEREVAFYR